MHKRFQLLLAALTCLVMPGVGASPAKLVDGPAPDFALRSTAGRNLRLSEFRSEVVVLNFWSKWCGKCGPAMSSLERLHREYADADVNVIGVAVEGKPEKAAAAVAEYGLTYPMLLDATQQVSKQYDLSRLPATLVIDREGTVRSFYQGSDAGSQPQLAADVSALLAD